MSTSTARSSAVRLPNRFPVGTRFVIEGRGGRIHLRYLEFPGWPPRRSADRGRFADEFPPPPLAPVRRPKIILPSGGTTQAPRELFSQSRVECPQPPNPSPIRQIDPGSRFGSRGLLFCGGDWRTESIAAAPARGGSAAFAGTSRSAGCRFNARRSAAEREAQSRCASSRAGSLTPPPWRTVHSSTGRGRSWPRRWQRPSQPGRRT